MRCIKFERKISVTIQACFLDITRARNAKNHNKHLMNNQLINKTILLLIATILNK